MPRKEGWEHLHNLWEEVSLAKSSKRFTTVFSLDVEKAFDSVWHDGLLYKLLELNIPPYLLRITANFLQDRTIKVKSGTSLSNPVTLNAGTPQGSVLSPTLYNIYVNDMPLEYQDTQAGQFADDVSKYVSSKKIKSNYIKLQHSLDLITAWCNKWRVILNPAKTQILTFGIPKTNKVKNSLRLNNTEIFESPTLKLLGITFQSNRSLNIHIDGKIKSASKRINLLKRLRGQSWGANAKTLLTFYKCYIRPILETGYICTATCSKSSLKKMQTLQNKALRRALKLPRNTKTKYVHKLAGCETIAERLNMLRTQAVARYEGSILSKELKVRQLLRQKAKSK